VLVCWFVVLGVWWGGLLRLFFEAGNEGCVGPQLLPGFGRQHPSSSAGSLSHSLCLLCVSPSSLPLCPQKQFKSEGPLSLYKGTVAPLLGNMLLLGIHFPTFHKTRDYLEAGDAPGGSS
jgi:hypothetical protein